jgi:hypothetical protein
VALMSARTTAARELAPVDALSGGIRVGFLCAAIISLFAVACIFSVQKPRWAQDNYHGSACFANCRRPATSGCCPWSTHAARSGTMHYVFTASRAKLL